jgi:ribosomal protein S18 acetylase RimI-like enzyme
VASALMDYTLREIQASGITTVELQVRTTNPGGIRFWQNIGFSPSGILANFYEDGAEAVADEEVADIRNRVRTRIRRRY